jgi:S-adenosylmethionine:tRNA ribosyltransferase-isomerase
MDRLSLSDFTYDLPQERIAQHPAQRREEAKLLVVDRTRDVLGDSTVGQFPDFLTGDELVILNDVRVSNARLLGHKESGGSVEVLVLNGHEVESTTAFVMARSSKPLRLDGIVHFEELRCRVTKVHGQGRYDLACPDGLLLGPFVEQAGDLPLPPYIERPEGPLPNDEDRYQTVFARHTGAVAAPTAGLHFTMDTLARIQAKGCELETVTLYVGPGTFQPVRCEDVDEHTMHSEVFDIPEKTALAIERAKREGRTIVAVGTTVVRTLEGAAALSADGLPKAGRASTEIFIRPGFSFRVVDQLLTNFHLPGSTLLMLVSALAGHRRIVGAYEHALSDDYRFFSYGDAMWIR